MTWLPTVLKWVSPGLLISVLLWIGRKWLQKHDARHEAEKEGLRKASGEALRQKQERVEQLEGELRAAGVRSEELKRDADLRLEALRRTLTRQDQLAIAEKQARLKQLELELGDIPMKKADEYRELVDWKNEAELRVKALFDGRGNRENPLRDPELRGVFEEFQKRNREQVDRWRREVKLREIEKEKLEAQVAQLKAGIEDAARMTAPAPAPAAA